MHRTLQPRRSHFAPQFLHVWRARGVPRGRASAGRARTYASLVLGTSSRRISSANLPSAACLNTGVRRPRACRDGSMARRIQSMTAKSRAAHVPHVELRLEVSCRRKSETITKKPSARALEHLPSPCMMTDELRSTREVAVPSDRLAPQVCEAPSLVSLPRMPLNHVLGAKMA